MHSNFAKLRKEAIQKLLYEVNLGIQLSNIFQNRYLNCSTFKLQEATAVAALKLLGIKNKEIKHTPELKLTTFSGKILLAQGLVKKVLGLVEVEAEVDGVFPDCRTLLGKSSCN